MASSANQAALELTPMPFRGPSQIDPFGSQFQPCFLFERIDGLFRQLAAVLGLLTESFCIGHCNRDNAQQCTLVPSA